MDLKKGIYAVVFLLVMLAVSTFLGRKPSYNWDMFPYMALAMEDGSVPFDTTHARVYRAAAASLPTKDFLAISQRQPSLMEDPARFQGILKYFDTKPLYNGTVSLLYQAGVSAVAATYLPSVASYFLLSLLLFGWIWKLFPDFRACFISWFIMALPFLVDSARLSTPDMMCALICMIGLYTVLEVAVVPGLLISWLATLVRPDAAILALLLTIALLRTRKITPLIFASVSLTGILVTLYLAGSLLVEFLFTASDYSPEWTTGEAIDHYVNSLRVGLPGLFSLQPAIFMLLCIATLYWRLRVNHVQWTSDIWCLLLLAVLLSFLIRFILHPAVEDRFLISHYVIAAIAFIQTLASRQPPAARVT